MFGVKVRLQAYLNQVRPWAMGMWNRGWYASDFANKQVKKDRMNPCAVIFPLPALSVSAFDKLFLSPVQYAALMNFNHAANNFNAMLLALNTFEGKPEDRYKMITALHVGAIGSNGTAGLFDAFIRLESSIKKFKKWRMK